MSNLAPRKAHSFHVGRAKAQVVGFDPAYVMRGFETLQDVAERSENLVRLLGRGNQAERELACRLEMCQAGDPCSSQACPCCMRKYRRWFVSECQSAQVDTRSHDNTYTISIIPSHLTAAVGQLSRLAGGSLNDWLRTMVRRAGVGHVRMIGGWDFSFNEGMGEIGYFQPHVYALCFGVDDIDSFTSRLRGQLRTNATVLRPLRVGKVSDTIYASSYGLKGVFFRRVSYLDDDGIRQTRLVPMKPRQVRELALYLDSIQISDRLFLRGFRRVGARLLMKPSAPSVSDPRNEKSKA